MSLLSMRPSSRVDTRSLLTIGLMWENIVDEHVTVLIQGHLKHTCVRRIARIYTAHFNYSDEDDDHRTGLEYNECDAGMIIYNSQA